MTTKKWRDVWEVHPTAEVFPLASKDELAALAKDIKENGQQVPVIFYKDRNVSPSVLYVLDGRNRLDAMESLGMTLIDVPDQPAMDYNELSSYDDTDPVAVVIGANIHRRHLTKAQKVQLIIAAKKAGDSWEGTRTFSPTPGKRGGSTKGQTGNIVDLAARQGISERTTKREIGNDRAKLAQSKLPRKKAAKPKATGVKPNAADRAANDVHLAVEQLVQEASRLSDQGWRIFASMQNLLSEYVKKRAPK